MFGVISGTTDPIRKKYIIRECQGILFILINILKYYTCAMLVANKIYYMLIICSSLREDSHSNTIYQMLRFELTIDYHTYLSIFLNRKNTIIINSFYVHVQIPTEQCRPRQKLMATLFKAMAMLLINCYFYFRIKRVITYMSIGKLYNRQLLVSQ